MQQCSTISFFYDDQLVEYDDGTNATAVLYDENWNGNINGIAANYDFNSLINIANNVSGFDLPTVYGYQYDQINRLIHADGTIGDLLDIQNLGDSYLIGDVELTYDRIGNINTLQRTLRNSDQTQGAPYIEIQHFAYEYGIDNNRLLQATGIGGTASRNYTYDAIGNVLTDDSKNLNESEYGRASYPFELTIDPDGDPQTQNDENISYLYSANDMRVYKKVVSSTETLEDYYLMDASGRTVAILKQGYPNDGWEYYVYGAEREARIVPSGVQTPGSNGAATTAEKQITKDYATFYVTDYLGNSRITYRPTGFHQTVGQTVYTDDFSTGTTGWIVGDGTISNANQNLEVTTDLNATNQLVSYNLGSGALNTGDSYILTLDADLGTAPALNLSILGTAVSGVNLTQGANSISFTYNGPLNPVILVSVTGGNGQNQQYAYSLDNVFVGTAGDHYTINTIEYVADYFPYGKIVRDFSNSDVERYLTTQHERDVETGLDYRGARYYDSDIGRFLSLDPLASNYPEWSDYHYVLCNPIVFTDPDGRSSDPAIDGSILTLKTQEQRDAVAEAVENGDFREVYKLASMAHDDGAVLFVDKNSSSLTIVYGDELLFGVDYRNVGTEDDFYELPFLKENTERLIAIEGLEEKVVELDKEISRLSQSYAHNKYMQSKSDKAAKDKADGITGAGSRVGPGLNEGGIRSRGDELKNEKKGQNLGIGVNSYYTRSGCYECSARSDKRALTVKRHERQIIQSMIDHLKK